MRSLIYSLALSALFFTSAHGAEELSLSAVNSKITQIKEAEVASAEKSPALETWLTIKELVESKKKAAKASTSFQTTIRLAPEELQQFNLKIKELSSSAPVEPDSSLSIDAIDAQLSQLKAKLKAHKAQEEALKKEESQRSARVVSLPTEMANAQITLNNLSHPNALGASVSDLEKAQYQLSITQLQALESQLNSLQLEDQLYRATEQLFRSKKELNQLELTRLNEEVGKWQELYTKKLSVITKETQQQAEQQLKQFSPIAALASITQENADLAELRSKLAEKTTNAQNLAKTISTQFLQVRDHSENAQERIQLLESSGLSIDTKTGELLRKQRASLPTSDTLKIKLQKHLVESTNAQIALFELKEKQLELTPDIKKEAQRIWTQVGSDQLKPEAVEDLLINNQQLLAGAIHDYSKYISSLHIANNDTQNLLQEVESYSLYLDERLLWIPSAKKLQVTDIAVEQQALLTLFSPHSFQVWWLALKKDWAENVALWLIFISLLGTFFTFRKKTLLRLAQMSSKAKHRHCTTILPSLKALVFTILLSQALAATLAFISWRVHSPSSVSQGLASAAMSIALLSFLKKISRENGLLISHLNIDAEKTKHFNTHCTWMLLSAPALAFLSTALPVVLPGDPQSGRLSFLLLMLLCAAFAHFTCRPSKQIIGSHQTSTWLNKAIYATVALTPLILALGSALGYISSIQTLASQTLLTLILIGCTLLLSRFCMRWILVSKRHLAKSQARQKYKAILAAEKNETEAEAPSLEETEAHAVDIVSLEEQTRRLVRIAAIVIISLGTWNIWSSTLPALSALDKVSVFAGSEAPTQSADSSITSTLLPGTSTEPESAAAKSPAEAETSPGITLKDLLVSLLFIVLTFAAARNIPGLLELTLLRRIELQPGSCYAITTVLRYIIVTFGALLAFGSIGITWSSVQWLAAAVTLGIGFGLQEIFANFVAGIIILFERPIRIGDVVTVGDISGRVSQIKIRATTIKQFNNRELLVPNKEFITGQLVNWSLCDSVLRFELNVGIAYGSDTNLATKILRDIADKHPQVLDSPKPEVIFTSFGASSLDFQLRGFVGHYEHLVSAQSELHYRIDDEFRKANIEIAFPQTDIHIRSLPANSAEILAVKNQ